MKSIKDQQINHKGTPLFQDLGGSDGRTTTMRVNIPLCILYVCLHTHKSI